MHRRELGLDHLVQRHPPGVELGLGPLVHLRVAERSSTIRSSVSRSVTVPSQSSTSRTRQRVACGLSRPAGAPRRPGGWPGPGRAWPRRRAPRGPPLGHAGLDHDRTRDDELALPRVPVGVAQDEHERPVGIERRQAVALVQPDRRRRRAARRARGLPRRRRSSARAGARRRAASAPTAASPSTRSARRAASAPASRSVQRPRRRPRRELGDPARRPRPAAPRRAPSCTAETIAAWTPSTCSGARARRRGRARRRPRRARARAGAATPVGPAGALHLERVGDHDAVEAELVAQQLDERPAPASPARRRRRRHADVRGHDRARRRPRSRPRTAAARARAARRGSRRTDGSSRCESATVSPWPGKCLAQAATPTLCRPSTNGRDVARDQLRVGAERADADDRARRVDEHVGDRREVEVDPDRAPARRRSPRRRAASAPRRRPRRARGCPGYELPLAASSRVTSPPSSSIATSTRPALGPQRGRQRRHLLAVADVAREEHDAAEPLGRAAARTQSGAVVAGEARERGRPPRPLELARSPLTAPAVSPNAIFRCTIRKKTITGIAISVEPAISAAPVGVAGSCRRSTRARPSPSASTGR